MDLREIKSSVVKTIMSSRTVAVLMEGKMSRQTYVGYLRDVYSYAQHSSQVIAIAGTRLVLKNPSLAEYLFHHAQEELGHDKWVMSDLKDMGLNDSEIADIRPSSPCLNMLSLEYYFAGHDNPVGLFGWMFALESLGGSVGSEIAEKINSVLGLNGKALYFLGGHGEADQHHSEDLHRVISEHVKDPADAFAFQTMVAESTRLYKEILDTAYSGALSMEANFNN
jgi:hypothetical protein